MADMPQPQTGLTPDPCLIFTAGKVLHRNVPAEQVGEALEASTEHRAWLFLPREDSVALQTVAERLHMDSLAVADVIGDHESLKVEAVGNCLVILGAMTQFVAAAPDLVLGRISMIAARRVLVILADRHQQQALVGALTDAEAEVLADGVPGALYVVMDALIDSQAAAVSDLQDEIESMSAELFEGHALNREQQLRAFRLRSILTKVRRITGPSQDVTARLANAAGRVRGTGDAEPADVEESILGTASARKFSDVADHAEHTAQSADALRDEIDSMYETSLALTDLRLNQVMKKLAGWAGILAVPTLVTGFLGMNVPFPGNGSKAGLVVGVVVMALAVIWLYAMFKRKDWL